MKTVYFIRHGQSAGNASAWQQQNSDTPLTLVGVQQAKRMAEHVAKLPIERIVASTFTRTQQTAHELSEVTHLPIESSTLFVEHRRPGVQLRKKKLHPHWLWVQLQLSLFSRYSTYHHSDEESPQELLERAQAALKFIESLPEEHIAVVTHGRFLKALHAVITFGEGVTGRMFLRASRLQQMHNTALMVATFDAGTWKVQAWNIDASHI